MIDDTSYNEEPCQAGGVESKTFIQSVWLKRKDYDEKEEPKYPETDPVERILGCDITSRIWNR